MNQAFQQFLNCYNLDHEEIQKHLNRGTRVGKVLRKALSTHPRFPWFNATLEKKLLGMVLQQGISAYHAEEYAPLIRFATTDWEIATVYDNSEVKSCMLGEGRWCGLFYASNGWAVATLYKDERLIGRCVVDPKAKKYLEVYGDGKHKLEAGLIILGYSQGSFFEVGDEVYLPAWNGSLMIPYIDWTASIWWFPKETVPYGGVVKAVAGFGYDEEDQELDEVMYHIQNLQSRDDLIHIGYRHEMTIANSREVSPGVWENEYKLEPATARPLATFVAQLGEEDDETE